MSESDSADPFDPLDVFAGLAEDEYGLWLGGHRAADELFGSDSSDSDDSLHDIDDMLDDIECERLPRERATYEYDGDVLENMGNDAEDPGRDWAELPSWVESQRWMSEFRMEGKDFDALLAVVQPYMKVSIARNKEYRQYTHAQQLAITIHFLAHCPTIRSLSTNFRAVSLSACELGPRVMVATAESLASALRLPFATIVRITTELHENGTRERSRCLQAYVSSLQSCSDHRRLHDSIAQRVCRPDI